jgi:putative transposase
VKTINVCQDNIGYDGGKKIKGRKRNIIVDTLGLILAVAVHLSTTHDSKSSEPVFKELKNKYLSGIIKIFADGGYQGELIKQPG